MYIYINSKQYHAHVRLPACIGRSTCTNVCILAAYIEQLLFVFCDRPKRATFRTQNWGRNSVGSPAYKFVAPVLGRWSGRLPFRKARVELRQWTSFINGFCALGCQDAGFTVYMFDKSYNCLNLFYFGTKKAQECPKKTHRWRSQDLPRGPSWTRPGWFQPWRGRTGQSGCRRR